MRYWVDDVQKLLSINSYRQAGLLPHKTSSGQFSGSKRHLRRVGSFIFHFYASSFNFISYLNVNNA